MSLLQMVVDVLEKHGKGDQSPHGKRKSSNKTPASPPKAVQSSRLADEKNWPDTPEIPQELMRSPKKKAEYIQQYKNGVEALKEVNGKNVEDIISDQYGKEYKDSMGRSSRVFRGGQAQFDSDFRQVVYRNKAILNFADKNNLKLDPKTRASLERFSDGSKQSEYQKELEPLFDRLHNAYNKKQIARLKEK